MIIQVAIYVAIGVFIAGIVFRIVSKIVDVKNSVTHTDVTAFEIDEELIAYIKRTGGFKK